MNCHHVVAETSPPEPPGKKSPWAMFFVEGRHVNLLEPTSHQHLAQGQMPLDQRCLCRIEDVFLVSCFCCDSFFHLTWAQQTAQRNFTFATNCSTRCVMFRHPVRCDDQTLKWGFCRCSNRNSRNICVLQFAHGVGELLFSWQSLHTNNSIYPRRQKAICN